MMVRSSVSSTPRACGDRGAAGHGHEVGDDVHRPAFGRPGQTGEELGFHLVGGTPGVVDAGVGFADEPGIVGGVDDLDTGGAGDGGPVCDELTDSVGQGVRDSGRAE
jgi:hypothetical protein